MQSRMVKPDGSSKESRQQVEGIQKRAEKQKSMERHQRPVQMQLLMQ